MITIEARNRSSNVIETRRFNAEKVSPVTAVARMGAWLTQLGWDERDMIIINMITDREADAMSRVRNRLRHTDATESSV